MWLVGSSKGDGPAHDTIETPHGRIIVQGALPKATPDKRKAPASRPRSVAAQDRPSQSARVVNKAPSQIRLPDAAPPVRSARVGLDVSTACSSSTPSSAEEVRIVALEKKMTGIESLISKQSLDLSTVNTRVASVETCLKSLSSDIAANMAANNDALLARLANLPGLVAPAASSTSMNFDQTEKRKKPDA